MQTHAVFEIEEGAMNVVVGSRIGGETRVLRSVRVALSDLTVESFEGAIRSLHSDLLVGVKGVHVVLGDRRSQHFTSTIPKMSSRDAQSFLQREAVRLANLQSVDEVLIAPRVLRRLPGDKFEVTCSALPRVVWSNLETAFANCDVDVVGLHTMESCLAKAVKAAAGEPSAVLEYNAGRVRFVLCIDKHPVQVRRFLIGSGGSVNSAALVTQLMMELPRTFDWLRETEQQLPDSLILGSRVTIDDESIDMLRGEDLKSITRAELPVNVSQSEAIPGLAPAVLLHELCSGGDVPSLLSKGVLQMPWDAGRLLTVLTAASIGLICSYSAVIDGTALLRDARAQKDIAAKVRDAESRLLAAQRTSATREDSKDDDTLKRALQMRRPISRLFSEISNSGDANVHLEEITFASKSKIMVTGLVDCSSRQEALAAMGRFSRNLVTLPYLQSGGDSVIKEVKGLKNRFGFKQVLAWRNP
jgi:hypothetical protein